MKFGQVPRDLAPPRTVVLQPSAFADDWADKPSTAVAIGLRFVSQQDTDVGRRQAEREAAGFYLEFRDAPREVDPDTVIDVFNDALIMHAVAMGTCDCNNVSVPYFQAAEDTVRIALTPEGARRIWDELVLLHKGSGPARPAADDAEVRRLARALSRGVTLDDEARKLCAYLLEKLGDQATSDGDDEPEDEEVAQYVAKAG